MDKWGTLYACLLDTAAEKCIGWASVEELHEDARVRVRWASHPQVMQAIADLVKAGVLHPRVQGSEPVHTHYAPNKNALPLLRDVWMGRPLPRTTTGDGAA